MMRKKRILLADDSPVIQSLTRNILQAQGFEVEGVKKGNPVSDMVLTGKYHLLILDLMLPDTNGIDIARQLRALPGKASEIPIIAISGNTEDYSPDDLKAAGIDSFLAKPINYDELLKTIQALLNL
jgi:two-component system cell cycle response regulator DivK